MHDRATFLAGSLADMQATIRAVDVKVAALIVCLLAPLQNIHRVFKHLIYFTEWAIRWPAIVVVVLFLLTWIAAFFALVRAIAATGNPAVHIRGAQNANGAFFLPAQFNFSRLHIFRNPRKLLSRESFYDVQNNLPSDVDVEAALVFEQMKLAYIRDLKIFRLDWGLRLSLLWLVLGLLIYTGSKFVMTEPPKKKPEKISNEVLSCQIRAYYSPVGNYYVTHHFTCPQYIYDTIEMVSLYRLCKEATPLTTCPR